MKHQLFAVTQAARRAVRIPKSVCNGRARRQARNAAKREHGLVITVLRVTLRR